MQNLAEKGSNFYNINLKMILEPNQNGEFIAIEPESGRYFLGKTSREVMSAAHNALPNARFYLQKVGYNFAHKKSGLKRILK